MKKLIILPYIHLIGLAGILFCLGFWIFFGYDFWKEINQSSLVGLYVFGVVFLILAVIAMIFAMKKMKVYPFGER